MSDTLIDVSSTANVIRPAAEASHAKNGSFAGAGAVSAAARTAGPTALEGDAVTVVGNAGAAGAGIAMATADPANNIPEPQQQLLQSTKDREFQEAFETVVSGAAENCRADMNSLFAEFIVSLREQRSAYNLARLSNRQITQSSAKAEVHSMEDAAALRETAEVSSGSSMIAAGVLQIGGGVTTVALTMYQIRKLPELINQTKEMAPKIKTATDKLVQSESEINKAQAALDLRQKNISPASTQSERVELETASQALVSRKTEYSRADADLANLNNTMNKTREQLTEVEGYFKLAGGISEITNGLSGSIQGIGRIKAAEENYEASMADVNAKKNSIRREISENDGQWFTDLANQALSILNSVQQANRDNAIAQGQTGGSMAQKMA